MSNYPNIKTHNTLPKVLRHRAESMPKLLPYEIKTLEYGTKLLGKNIMIMFPTSLLVYLKRALNWVM